MKFFIYLISNFPSEFSLIQFVKKFRKDNKLRACLFASERLPFRDYNFLVSLDKIDFSSDSPKIFSSDSFRPYSIFIVKEKELNFKIKPAFIRDEGKYKTGIWIKDSTSGIGTITFINPEDNSAISFDV